MKYLKHFEYYFEDEIKEIKLRSGTEVTTQEKAEEILLKFNINDIPIYRGMAISKYPGEIFIIDPKRYTRKSAYTRNYYTLIIDYLDSWKKFPKRSKSLICSTVKSDSSSYGQLYRVIPLNRNSKWGVCSEHDFWWSFPNIKKKYNINTLDGFNIYLETLFNHFFNIPLRDIPKTHFIDSLNSLFKTVKKYSTEDFNSLFREVIHRNIDFPKTFEELCDMFDPDKNKFISCNYNDLQHILWNSEEDDVSRVELWTNSKCLLIPIEYYRITEDGKLISKYSELKETEIDGRKVEL